MLSVATDQDLERVAKIAQLRAEGATLKEIGDRFGISRARVWQILAKLARPKAPRRKVRRAEPPAMRKKAEPTKLCARCGLEKPRPEFYGHAWCASCEQVYEAELRAELDRQGPRTRYWQRKAAGLCVGCGAPARPGLTQCAGCARKSYERTKARHEKVGSTATRRAARRRG